MNIFKRIYKHSNLKKESNFVPEEIYVVYTIKGINPKNSMINIVTTNYNIAYKIYHKLVLYALIDNEIRAETWKNNELIDVKSSIKDYKDSDIDVIKYEPGTIGEVIIKE